MSFHLNCRRSSQLVACGYAVSVLDNDAASQIQIEDVVGVHFIRDLIGCACSDDHASLLRCACLASDLPTWFPEVVWSRVT